MNEVNKDAYIIIDGYPGQTEGRAPSFHDTHPPTKTTAARRRLRKHPFSSSVQPPRPAPPHQSFQFPYSIYHYAAPTISKD